MKRDFNLSFTPYHLEGDQRKDQREGNEFFIFMFLLGHKANIMLFVVVFAFLKLNSNNLYIVHGGVFNVNVGCEVLHHKRE